MPPATLSDKENRMRGSSSRKGLTQSQSQHMNGKEELALVTGSTSNGLAYDPDQDLDEKRRIRREYRQEIETAESDRANIANLSVDALNDRVARAEELFENVKNPMEAILDSHLLLLTSDLGAQKAKAMKHDANAFDTDDYVNKLITVLGGRKPENMDDDDDSVQLEWDVAGWRAAKRSRRVIGMDFMLGPLSLEQKKRVTTKRAQLVKNKDDETRPQELKEGDIERSENETTKNVRDVFEILDNYTDPTKADDDDTRNQINIFRLVVNPESFAQTVENIFYLSFSIRDGQVALNQSEETGEFVVYTCEPPDKDDYAKDDLKKQQLVLEMDMETWRLAIEMLDLKKPMIPTRKAAMTRLGDKWYG